MQPPADSPRKTKPRRPHPHKALSAAFCRSVTQPGRYCDGNGLYLHVEPSGTRHWVQRLVIHGKGCALGLGSFALVPRREHRVPLCSRAVEILDDARRLGVDSTGVMPSGLAFPSQRGKAIADARLSGVLQQLGIGAVPHGFRSSFRDWASERTDHPREVIEAALAHVVRNQTEAAYARSDLFERRRLLMDDWAAYVGRQRECDASDS